MSRTVRPRRRALAITLLALALVLIVLPVAARRLTDWMWYQEVGLERIFWTKVVVQWTLALLTGAVALAFLYANLRAARPSLMVAAASGVRPVNENPLRRVLPTLAGPLIWLLAIGQALVMATNWVRVLQWWNAGAWGEADPVFHRDVGYYVFTLPVVDLAVGAATDLLAAAILFIVLPLYMLSGEVVFRGKSLAPVVAPAAARHAGVLVALVFLTRALQLHFVRVPSLLYSTSGPLTGASYADLHATLPAMRLLTLVALLGAAAVLWGGFRRRLGPAIAGAAAAYLGLSVLALGIVPATYRKLVVQPNELAREAPQIASHLAATRRAWGLDSVATNPVVPGWSRGKSAPAYASNAALPRGAASSPWTRGLGDSLKADQ